MADKSEEKLTRKQEQALVALLEKGTVREAAKKCDVSETTLWRWLRDDSEFQRRYSAARQQLVHTAIARLQSATGTAITTLQDICQDSKAPATARIAAARAILSGAFRGADLTPASDKGACHKHLCRVCDQKFDCEGADCESFEFAVCPSCPRTPGKRGREAESTT